MDGGQRGSLDDSADLQSERSVDHDLTQLEELIKISTAAISENQNGIGAPLKGRGAARTLVAVAAVLVAGVGIWGALSAFAGVRAYERSKRLETGYEQARYALALERSALRDPNLARARQQFAAATGSLADGLSLVRRSGRPTDVALARLIATRHAQLIRAAATSFAARRAGDPEEAGARARGTDRHASSIDAKLSRAIAGVRRSNMGRWPARPIEKVEVAVLALLLGLALAASVVVLTRLIGYRRRLERARNTEFARLSQAALTDSLTGLGNHRGFYEDLKREIARRARTGSCFSIVMLDLDGLKQINDTLGHQVGDERIRAVGDCIRATVRESDSAYRTGGDEFMVLLPNERAWGAFTFAQRLQREAGRRKGGLGVSCGIAESTAFEGTETLVKRADLALYDAKRARRRIVVYADGLAPTPAVRLEEEQATRHHHRLLASALARAVDAKDAGTRNHCETVATLCVLIGQELRLDGDRIERLRLAGLLHDVGKLGLKDDLVLPKPGRLDTEEAAAMSEHVHVGHTIVAAAELEEEAWWVLHHHEHVDGSGYPDGLRGEEIPLESRIILVADAFEAMTAERSYRVARTREEALAELERCAGSQFDRVCVAALRSALDDSDSTTQLRAAPTPPAEHATDAQVTAA